MNRLNFRVQCENPYHLHCLTPPLSAVPEGEWFCLKCAAEAESRQHTSTDAAVSSNKKRSREADDVSMSDTNNPEADAEGSDEEIEEHPQKKPKNSPNGHLGSPALFRFSFFIFGREVAMILTHNPSLSGGSRKH